MTTAESWIAGNIDAACAAVDPDLFFPAGRDPVLAEAAKTYCRRCPLIRECLSYALTHNVEGIWGATTPTERDDLRRRHHIAATDINLDTLVRPAMEAAS